MIFGTNAPSPTQQTRVSIDPPSPYARQIPLHVHPSKATPVTIRDLYKFNHYIKTTTDPVIKAQSAPDSPTRTTVSTVGGGGLEWGGWLEFVDKEERITSPSLAFLVDVFVNLVRLLPKEVRGNLDARCDAAMSRRKSMLISIISWFPTMVLSLEFKKPIPSIYASRTVGIYSVGRFLDDPDHRHDTYVEIWTAPSNVGEGVDSGEWRSKQVCLATATQMSLTIPLSVNVARAKRDAKL